MLRLWKGPPEFLQKGKPQKTTLQKMKNTGRVSPTATVRIAEGAITPSNNTGTIHTTDSARTGSHSTPRLICLPCSPIGRLCVATVGRRGVGCVFFGSAGIPRVSSRQLRPLAFLPFCSKTNRVGASLFINYFRVWSSISCLLPSGCSLGLVISSGLVLPRVASLFCILDPFHDSIFKDDGFEKMCH